MILCRNRSGNSEKILYIVKTETALKLQVFKFKLYNITKIEEKIEKLQFYRPLGIYDIFLVTSYLNLPNASKCRIHFYLYYATSKYRKS